MSLQRGLPTGRKLGMIWASFTQPAGHWCDPPTKQVRNTHPAQFEQAQVMESPVYSSDTQDQTLVNIHFLPRKLNRQPDKHISSFTSYGSERMYIFLIYLFCFYRRVLPEESAEEEKSRCHYSRMKSTTPAASRCFLHLISPLPIIYTRLQ